MTTEPITPITPQNQSGTLATQASGSTPATPPAAAAGPVDQAVPYERFREVNERLRAAEATARELTEREAEREREGQSEVERLTSDLTAANQRADTAEGRVLILERGQLVANAATAAGFADPQDAVAFLTGQLASIEDQAAATAAVTTLAESKPHLLKAASAEPRPTPIGGLTGAQPAGDVPVGQDGKPDAKLGLGRDLLASLTGKPR